jgi:peptidylprolyl isomerase
MPPQEAHPTMRAFLAALAAAGLVLGACGDDDDAGTPGGATAAARPSPQTGGVRPSSPTSGAGAASPAAAPTAAATAGALPETTDGNAPGIPPLTGEVQSEGSLRFVDEAVGSGATPKAGQRVQVHYTGWLTNGQQFDSSRTPGRGPYEFIVGQGAVIRGWDIGIASMQVGGKRRLIIPPELAYGAEGFGRVIPPNATLIFDVELLGITP